MDFDVFLEQPAFMAADSNAGLFCAGFYAGTNEDGTCMSVAPTYTIFTGNGPAFPTERWVHVRYDVDPQAKVGAMEVNGAPFAKGPFTLPAGSGAPRMLVQVGVLGYNVPAPAFSATFDNVTIELC